MDPVNLIELLSLSSEEISSSGEDSFELECVFGSQCRCHYRFRIPRVQNSIETVIDAYNAGDFKQALRMSRTTLEYLLNVLGPHLQADSVSGRQMISPRKQLLITLWFLGTPDSYRSVVSKFDCGCATAWRAVTRVVNALYNYRNYYVRWPTEEEGQATSDRVMRHWGVSSVVGFVDGTHIEIPVPQTNSQSFINRKGYPSLQAQIVCDYRLKFINCFAEFPGSVHDMRVFRNSGVQDVCSEEFFPRGIIF